ncbi:uncharacterized protein LOC134241127 [Saccostrea cucullata]|uniref:uncharacterized protein LOC134241127 n=1 Tax=Saccostrea cuccullata TaxID=36930 RepID=UPI002ED3D816
MLTYALRVWENMFLMIMTNIKWFLSNNKKHPTKICELQCKECNIPICSLCSASIQHKKYGLLVLSEIHVAKKESIRNDANEIVNYLFPAFESLAVGIETQMTSLDEDYGNLTALVTQHGEEWHKEIERIVEEMKNEINEMKGKHKSILKQHLDEIKNVQSFMDQTLLTLKEIEESNKVSLALEYSSKITEFRKLPPKVKISLPTFNTGNINRKKNHRLFGSLSSLSIKREEGFILEKKEVTATYKELLEVPEAITSISIGYCNIRGVTCTNEKEIWICGNSCDLKCFNIQGSDKKTIKTKSGKFTNDLTWTGDGDLVYSERTKRTVNKVSSGQIEEIIRLKGWVPEHLCVTSSGELLVTMYSEDETQYKVVRYSNSKEKQTIQFDENGKPLYSGIGYTKYICENRNLDMCVADYRAGVVVVVDQAGKLRFRYTGHSSTTKKQPFKPLGITTDSQCQILTSDCQNNYIHIIDQNGRFLCYIHNCDLNSPTVLCVDKNDNLFVTTLGSGNVIKIKYLR